MTDPALRLAVAVLWLVWLLYWWISARNVKVTRREEPAGSQLRKSRTEESFMRETFPDYAEYQRETRALIPFVY